MDELLKGILKYGFFPAVFCIFLFLIVQDPSRAYKLKSLLIYPFFRLFKWFKREYVTSEVAGTLSQLFSKVVNLPNNDVAFKFKINWVKNDESPILKSGEVIIRMRRDTDQTKNVLTATRYALTKIVCPNIRHNISPLYCTAIDFTFLHKLADRLGNHGKAVFREYFLNPETETNPEFIAVLQQLLVLDKYGLFSTIFVNELDHVGDGLFGDADIRDKTDELKLFLEFLMKIAEREIGEEGQLIHFSNSFKVSLILLAKAQMASKRGLFPYLRRLNINIEKGCDTIYIIAFPPAFEFLNKFVKILDGNQRITIAHIYQNKDNNLLNAQVNVCCLRSNKLFTKDNFAKKIEANGIKVGNVVQGSIIDSSAEMALVTVLGVDAIIRKSEATWLSFESCADILQVGQNYRFLVKSIDISSGNIELSRKFPEENPWQKIAPPLVGEEVEMEILSIDAVFVRGFYKSALEVKVPIKELSWNWEPVDEIYLSNTIKVKVLNVVNDQNYILASYRQTTEDPWPKLHKSLIPGSFFNGVVIEIKDDFVIIKLDNDLIGRIPGSSFIEAGFEYANFKQNLIIGQVLEVVVTKVFIAKQWIRLDLKRNWRV